MQVADTQPLGVDWRWCFSRPSVYTWIHTYYVLLVAWLTRGWWLMCV